MDWFISLQKKLFRKRNGRHTMLLWDDEKNFSKQHGGGGAKGALAPPGLPWPTKNSIFMDVFEKICIFWYRLAKSMNFFAHPPRKILRTPMPTKTSSYFWRLFENIWQFWKIRFKWWNKIRLQLVAVFLVRLEMSSLLTRNKLLYPYPNWEQARP